MDILAWLLQIKDFILNVEIGQGNRGVKMTKKKKKKAKSQYCWWAKESISKTVEPW